MAHASVPEVVEGLVGSGEVTAEKNLTTKNPRPKLDKPTIIKKPNGTNGANGFNNGALHGNSLISNHPNRYQLTVSKRQKVTILEDVVVTTREKFICDFEDLHEQTIDAFTVDDFLSYIEEQRLTQMPNKGSKWDRVLKWAEFFALQVSNYETAVSSSVSESKTAAQLIWIASRTLLELGPSNAEALEPTFRAFYKLGLTLSFFHLHSKLLGANAILGKQTAEAFKDVLILVRDVASHYHRAIRQISHGDVAIQLDFNHLFGKNIHECHQRKSYIIDAMWECQLSDDVSSDIATLRNWLSPRDKTLRKILTDRHAASESRREYTCEWFQRHLLEFSRGEKDILAVVGPAGSGKTYLYEWTMERLLRPLGKKPYETLSISIQHDIPSMATTLAITQQLCFQLLGTNIGDAGLFTQVVEAYNMSLASATPEKVEAALWEAVDAGLKSYGVEKGAPNLMIVLDGLDECGQESFDVIVKRLENLSSKHKKVQTVFFARQYATSNTGALIMAVQPDQTHDDMHHIISHSINVHPHLKKYSDHEREVVVEQIVHDAKGNFLWALMTSDMIVNEKTPADSIKFLKECHKTPDEIVRKRAEGIDMSSADVKSLLAWLLVSERPFTVLELRALFQVQLKQKQLVDRSPESVSEIIRACHGLVSINHGIVCFGNSLFRSYFIKQQVAKKHILPWKEAQTDLTIRILAYCNFSLNKHSEPMFDIKEMNHIGEMFKAHSLLEYAVLNWPMHIQKSSLCKTLEKWDLSAEFKAIFPSSTQLALIEWAYWETHTSICQALFRHSIALQVRQEVFSENHECVLQTLITCGHFYEKMSRISDAMRCFYRASRIGKKVLKENSTLRTICAAKFLTLSETVSITVTTRTEVITQREEILNLIIETARHQHGETSDMVISYYNKLVELYVSIHEEGHAQTVCQKLQKIIMMRHGPGSEEENAVSNKLLILLKDNKGEDTTEDDQHLFSRCVSYDIWDIRRINMTFKAAVSYEKRGEWVLAEELYVTLWRKLTELCHQNDHHFGVEIHIHTINFVLDYARYLQRCKRQSEASSVLICIWNEYEEHEFDSKSLFCHLKEIGEMMRACGLFSVAASVFRKCSTWFSKHGHYEYSSECETLISETTIEILSIKNRTEYSIRETFERSISRTSFTSESIKMCQDLISTYMKLENWSEAIEVTRRSLLVIWKAIISGGGIITLPKNYEHECVGIAISYAICHYSVQQFHEAEEIYIRIFRACRNSCHIHDERLTKSYKCLVSFYTELRQWHKVFDIYQELLIEYRKHMGKSHKLTIEVLYNLGAFCAEHGHGNSLEYYEEIVSVLNESKAHCHQDASQAMLILCQVYYENGHWRKLKDTCKALWEAWTHHQHEYHFDANSVQKLYNQYVFVLTHDSLYDQEIIRKITCEFKDTSVKAFGALSAITIHAMIYLAEVCMTSEKHYQEAIQIYEEVIFKTITKNEKVTVISEKKIKKVREDLAKTYINVCTKGSASTEVVERAVKMLVERYEHLRTHVVSSRKETLILLGKIVDIYIKLKTKESHIHVVRMLQDSFIEMITKESDSGILSESATILGGIFVNCGEREHGLDLTREVKRQIFTRTFTSKKFSFKIPGSVGKSSYIFLAVFEQILLGSVSTSFAEIMTDLLIETSLYEHYHHCIKSSTDITATLISAARLRSFLLTHHREQIAVLEQDSYKIFLKKWGSCFKTKHDGIFDLYISILEVYGSEENSRSNIGTVACISSTKKVLSLLSENKAQQAYEVALNAFAFIEHERAYHDLHNVDYGFKLSEYTAGCKDTELAFKEIDADMKHKMLELSRTIVRSVFKACKESKINFARLRLEKLNDLVGLLGQQENYVDLEWLLTALWSSRDIQRPSRPKYVSKESGFEEPPPTVPIGIRLVQARFLAKSTKNATESALKLCTVISYNLRRVWGSLEPYTLDSLELLSQLYVEAGHFREAMGVHEEILRLVLEGDDGDDRTWDEMPAARVRLHIDLLRKSYERLGGWDKGSKWYTELVVSVMKMPVYQGEEAFKGLEDPHKWKINSKTDISDGFVGPRRWEFLELEDSELSRSHFGAQSAAGLGHDDLPGHARGDGSGSSNGSHRVVPGIRPVTIGSGGRARARMGVKRASSNWGIGSVQQLVRGDRGEAYDD